MYTLYKWVGKASIPIFERTFQNISNRITEQSFHLRILSYLSEKLKKKKRSRSRSFSVKNNETRTKFVSIP